ncbi:MAG: exodeoxyribonuclease VII small subunit [Lachnospiraceae bacterium]|nr:exodeoxyribonuclease VII small subunit [Lachnospiraceae bacterium]
MKKSVEKKDINIEDSFKTLDKIISQMDDEKCSIEKSIELYENGIKLVNDISKKIEKIDKDLKVLNK